MVTLTVKSNATSDPTLRGPLWATDILSIQLYTLRSLGELDRVLDTVKQAGYGHVETVGSQLDDAENVRTKLDARRPQGILQPR